MKKVLSMLVVICIMITSFSLVSYADDSIKIKINGYNHEYDVMPVIINSRTMVPMRGIFESLGADISWDGETKTVRAFGLNGTQITHIIGESAAVVNGDIVTLDTPSQIVNGRTMVPVRFVSEALGEKVDWDADTKTVIIGDKLVAKSKGLATLKSTIHRPVPTEFTRSKDLNDLEYYSDFDVVLGKREVNYDDAKLILSPEEFIREVNFDSKIEGAKCEKIAIDGEGFIEALRVEVPTVPNKDTDIIGRFEGKLEGKANVGDSLLVKFTARCVSTSAEDGLGKVKIQIEAPETFKKALFEEFEFDNTYRTFFVPCAMAENSINVGVRFAYNAQTIEIADFHIYNFGDYPLSELPSDVTFLKSLAPEAEWRKEANERIEKIRKGDFKVIVKDKDGNIIPDAKVKADMFEHEFQFGSVIGGTDTVSMDKVRGKTFVENYNSAVFESNTKMGLHKPESVRAAMNLAKINGIKYFRGHSIVWEKFISGLGNPLMDPALVPHFEAGDKEGFDQIIKDYMKYVIEYYPEMKEWDVANEIISNSLFRDKFGAEYLKEYLSWMHDMNPDVKVLYNEARQWNVYYMEMLDFMKEIGAMDEVDKLGLQCHFNGTIKTPEEMLELYDNTVKRSGLEEIIATEYSTGVFSNEKQHADFNRDFMIATFSHPNMTGIYMWGHWTNATSKYHMNAPLYDEEWNLKKGGQAYQDLVYNKWWTNEEGTTNANGEFGLRGFYGDYDVTVEANGKAKTVMVAFHKGYDNILEITMD